MLVLQDFQTLQKPKVNLKSVAKTFVHVLKVFIFSFYVKITIDFKNISLGKCDFTRQQLKTKVSIFRTKVNDNLISTLYFT